MGMTGDSSPLLAPVWEGGTIWQETFAMIEENGQCSAPFLYSPEKIIRIESYDGKNVYELGRDCFVKDGRPVSYTHLGEYMENKIKLFFQKVPERFHPGKILDNLPLTRKLMLLYLCCVLLPLILTDSIIFSLVIKAEQSSSQHEMENIAEAIHYTPVSYTHLDVYKRQK